MKYGKVCTPSLPLHGARPVRRTLICL